MHKEDFPIFKNNPNLIYLDNAATSQKPQVVIESVKNFMEKTNANAGRGLYESSVQAMQKFHEAKQTIAKFINAKPNEIIITKNTTESINQLVYTIDSLINWESIKNKQKENPNFQPEILLTEMEHHSNIVPWQQFAKHVNFKLRFIKVNSQNLELDLEDFKKNVSEKTQILAITHASNVLGCVNPVKEIISQAKAKNPDILTIIDAAQSAPHIKIDIKEIDADFLALSGHKLLGPTGIGVLYGKEKLLEKLRPFHFGGGMVKSVTLEKFEEADLPEKFEAGTQNIAGAIALAEAIKYIEKIGIKNLQEYEQELKNYTLTQLEQIDNIKIFHPKNKESLPIISFSLENFHPHDVAEFLSEKNIAVRAGHHCCMPLMKVLGVEEGLTRISLLFYNDKSDIDKLISSLKELTSKNSPSNNEQRQLIFDLYKNPENFGSLQNTTHQAHAHNTTCGDEIEMQIKINKESSKVEEIKFNGHGCAISIASASLITDLIKTKNLTKEQILKLQKDDVLKILQIPISPARIKCALLPLEVAQRALYEN